MSRSCKKVPCVHIVTRHKGMKRAFNKRIRRMGIDEVPSFGAYRKANEIWDDDDYRVVGETYTEYRRGHLLREPCASEDEMRRKYYRFNLAK